MGGHIPRCKRCSMIGHDKRTHHRDIVKVWDELELLHVVITHRMGRIECPTRSCDRFAL